MRLTIDVAIDCKIRAGDVALLMVEAASCDGQTVVMSSLDLAQGQLSPAGGGMVWASASGTEFNLHYTASVDITRKTVPLASLRATPSEALPAEVVPFLRPSRYCQSDLFTDFTQRQFGGMADGAKIAAIRDWIAAELTYVPGSSNTTTTVLETFATRQGVCRDFAHMLCTLARAARIPARYASVYGAEVTPQDFHAVAQVWLDGGWHVVDASGMGAPHEMAVIATGRDAADVAYMETAEWAELVRQNVTVVKN